MTEKERWQFAERMDRLYRSIKPWHPFDNPDGPTGTLQQRRTKKMLLLLQYVEEQLRNCSSESTSK